MLHNPSLLNPCRVPNQPHLKLFYADNYNGYPVQQIAGGLIEPYLARLCSTVNSVLNGYRRLYAVRVDLHFPMAYVGLEQQVLGNEYLQFFIKALRRKLEVYKLQRQQLGLRVHEAGFEYVWARESGSNSGKPHFHLLLLFNRNAFCYLGNFRGVGNLSNRIGESWAEALGLHVAEGANYVYYPLNGQYRVDFNHPVQVGELIHRASYLAKAATKNFLEGFHVFGCSRV